MHTMRISFNVHCRRLRMRPPSDSADPGTCFRRLFGLLLMSLFPALVYAQSADQVLTTAWEASWNQTGFPVAVRKWAEPIRVGFSGSSIDRHKPFALLQLKIAADAAGISLSEAAEGPANLEVEFFPLHAALPSNQPCSTSYTTRGGVIRNAKVRANEQSVHRCMLHEAMHVMGLPGHPMRHSVLTYFARGSELTGVDNFLLKVIYSEQVSPNASPLALLAAMARALEAAAPEGDKESVRRAGAAFLTRTVKEMEDFAAGIGEPPAVLYRSSKATGNGIARGQIEMQYFLGASYLNGDIVAADQAKGLDWLAKAAGSSHTLAQALIAKVQHAQRSADVR